VRIEVDSAEISRVLALIDEKHITTGRMLLEYINNDRAFVLVSKARTAGREMPELSLQSEPDCLEDVVETLRDLDRLALAVVRAGRAVPPEAVTDRAQLDEWIEAYGKAISGFAGDCPRKIVDAAVDWVTVAVAGLRDNSWLDTDLDYGWIRFDVEDVPR
jgi:hypothetical protein